jgi:hypothetical protein
MGAGVPLSLSAPLTARLTRQLVCLRDHLSPGIARGQVWRPQKAPVCRSSPPAPPRWRRGLVNHGGTRWASGLSSWLPGPALLPTYRSEGLLLRSSS